MQHQAVSMFIYGVKLDILTRESMGTGVSNGPFNLLWC